MSQSKEKIDGNKKSERLDRDAANPQLSRRLYAIGRRIPLSFGYKSSREQMEPVERSHVNSLCRDKGGKDDVEVQALIHGKREC